MRNRIALAALVFLVIFAHLNSGCSDKPGTSALYILEEFEAASAVSDPEERLERLKLFVGNHTNHPYHVLGHRRIFETIADDLEDLPAALRYYDGVLSGETDPVVRGSLLYRQFAYLWKAERAQAIGLAERLCEGDERYFRLFLYMGYYLMDEEDRETLAERCFRRALELASNDIERSQGQAILAIHLDGMGRRKEAYEFAARAAGNPMSDELLGRILWEEGKREEALEVYIRLVAVRPGAWDDVALDSLYAFVNGSSQNLPQRIIQARIKDEGELADRHFVNLEGRSYRLSDYRGTVLVISVWSPT
ncbi:MAG: tetratricopeptide repeat protein [bacterium]|nr:MAG: tetratricopeptide repeat protein [bacterium]